MNIVRCMYMYSWSGLVINVLIPSYVGNSKKAIYFILLMIYKLLTDNFVFQM